MSSMSLINTVCCGLGKGVELAEITMVKETRVKRSTSELICCSLNKEVLKPNLSEQIPYVVEVRRHNILQAMQGCLLEEICGKVS